MPSLSSTAFPPLSFDNVNEFRASLITVEVPENGTGSVKIGPYCYQVNFQEQTIKETFCQKVRAVFVQCVGHDYVSASKLKEMLFPGRDYAIARSAFRHQQWRETGKGSSSSGELSFGRGKLVPLCNGEDRGGFGVVTYAAPETGGLMLACKIPKWTRDARIAHKKEHDILLRLDHPNIIRIDAKRCKSDGVEMELVMGYGGLSLEKIIKNDESICGGRAKSTMVQVLQGLQYLKKEGVLHGDIKPDNILVNPNSGLVSLVDFGLAQQLPASGKLNQPWGTPAYMAPEVGRRWDDRRSYGLEADMFSAGCVFYEMLTKRSFVTDCGVCDSEGLAEEMMRRITTEQMPILTESGAVWMRKLLCGMLHRNPQERLTPAEALSMLQHIAPETQRVSSPR